MALSVFKDRLSKVGQMLSASVGSSVGIGLPVAVDFGTSSLKVLQLASTDPPTLGAAACIETPEPLMNDPAKRLDFQVQALPKLIRQGGFKGKRAVCAIPSWQTMCTRVQVQRTEGVPMNTLVETALAVQAQVDPSALCFRTIEAATQGGKSELIVVSTQRTLVDA